jgi:branched-subunit amino acid transport protein
LIAVQALRRRSGAAKALFLLLAILALSTSAIAVANVALALAVPLWFVLLTRERRWREAFSSPIVGFFGVFVALLVLSAVFSLHPGRSLFALKGLFTFLLVPLFADGIETVEDAGILVGALGVAAAAEACLGVWQYLHGADTLRDRIEATLSHYMTFSGILLVAALLFLGIALEGRRHRAAAGALAALLGATILLTFTRNAYVGLFVAVAVYLALRRPAWLAALPAVAGGIYFAAPAGIRDRLVSTFNPADPTNRDRIDMAIAGGRMVRDFPVFGVGLSLVKPYYPLYRVPDAVRWSVPHLHDNLVQIAAESGLFAAAAYVAILVCFFRTCGEKLAKEENPDRRGLLAGALLAILGITAAGFFEYNFGDVEVLMTTLIVLSIPFARVFRRDRAPD